MLRSSPEFRLAFACPRALACGRLPWGPVPHRGISSRSPLADRFPTTCLRSVHSVSHALDGLLLLGPCALVSSRCHVQGSRSRGLFPQSGRITSSVTVPLSPFVPPACRLPGASERHVDLRGLLRTVVRDVAWTVHPRGTRYPSCVFSSLGFRRQDLGSAIALPPLTAFTTRDCVSPASLTPSVSIDLLTVASVPRGPSRSSFPAFDSVSLVEIGRAHV